MVIVEEGVSRASFFFRNTPLPFSTPVVTSNGYFFLLQLFCFVTTFVFCPMFFSNGVEWILFFCYFFHFFIFLLFF